MSVCLLAQYFKEDLVNYVKVRNVIIPWEEAILLRYIPTQNGKDAIFETPTLTEPSILLSQTFPAIDEKTLLSKMHIEANNAYAMFNKKIPPKITLEFESSELRSHVLRKYYLHDGEKILLGNVLIYLLNKRCTLEAFAEFMNRVNTEANRFGGDFMSVEPVIVAEGYEPLVGFFISKYNENEILARKQPITAFVASGS
jgi:hypothetical protein